MDGVRANCGLIAGDIHAARGPRGGTSVAVLAQAEETWETDDSLTR